jgi:transglutaminase-like putative cysteine protease
LTGHLFLRILTEERRNAFRHATFREENVKFTRLAVLSLLTAILISAVPSTTFSGSLWGKVSDAEWQQGPPASYPDANAAVLFDVCTLSVSIDQIEMTHHVRYKLFNSKGAKEVGEISISYDKDDSFKEFRAQTITPNGKTIKVDGKDVHVKTVGDWRTTVFAFPSADSGCIVEYSYRDVNRRYAYIDPWYFQSGTYTFKSSYTLVLGPGFSYVTAFSNMPAADRVGVQGELTNASNFALRLKTFTWSRHDLLPVVDEPFMGATTDFLSSLNSQLVSLVDQYNNIHFIKNWQDLGIEYQKWLDGYNSGGDLDEIIAKATAGATTPEEKAQRLYEYVAANITTRRGSSAGVKDNESLGDICRSGSGDGEDKNLLLCALLNKIGAKAWPVLISTRDHRRFNPEIYQVQQFNYKLVFAQFDSSVVFMDAVSKYCPFGMLPPNKLVDGGFLIDGKNSQLVKVLRNEPKTYRLDLTDVNIDSTGLARCSTSCSFGGYYAPTYGELHEETTPEDFVKKYFISKIDENGELISNQFAVDSLGRCRLDAVYTLKNLVRQLDNNLILKPISYRFRENPFTKEKRYFPIDFEFAQTYHNVMAIHSDRPVLSATLPPDVNVQIDGASFRWAAVFENGVVRVDAKLVLTKPIYPPSQYADIKQLFESMAKAQQSEIVLVLGS